MLTRYRQAWIQVFTAFSVLAIALAGCSTAPAARGEDALTALAEGWQSQDVGNTGAAGSLAVNGDTFVVRGAGDTIGGGYDQFHMAYLPLSGDGEITARLVGVENAAPGTEAGVIVRETLDGWPPAREVFVGLNNSAQAVFEVRRQPETNAEASFVAATTPQWVRLERRGNVFTGLVSGDGQSWTQTGSAEVGMARDVFIGLAGGGKTFGELATSTFDNVQVRSGPPAPWEGRDIGNTGAAGTALYTPSSGTFTLQGAGDDVGGSYDQFYFVSQPLSGDARLVARLTGIESGSGNTKAGLVLRETLDGWPPAREAVVGVRADGRSFFSARLEPETNAAPTEGPVVALPAWVRLERRGGVVVGSVSPDNRTWTEIGRAQLALSTAHAGLAGGGETFGKLATSTFDNVSLTALAGRPVRVGVDWNRRLYETTPLSYGLNLFQGFDPELASSARYNDNLAYLNPGVVRYHSWEMMGDSKTTRNGWIDVANRRWDAEKINRALSGPRLRAARAINIPGWPAWMDRDGDEFLDADQVDAFAAWCAELVRIVNRQGRHRVEYWEPTNERDDLYYVRFNGGPDRLDELIDIYNRAARAMKAVDPTIQVGGPAFARPDLTAQVERFVAGTANERPRTLDFLSIHGYASGDQNDSDTYIYNRVLNADDPAAGSLAKHAADVRAIVDRLARGRRIPVWFDEYNISWVFTNNDPRMHNHKGAVYDALAMVHFADAGMTATAAWNEQDGVYGKADNDGRLRPSAHVFRLMNTFMVGSRVATTTSDPAAVVPFAVRGLRAGSYGLLLVNRSNALQEVTTDLGGGRRRAETFSRYEVSAAGFSQTTVAASTPSDPLALPPHSVTLLVDER